MQETFAESLGRQVRIQMLLSRTNQADLAAALNTSQQAVSRRLLGRVSFTVEELANLSHLFDVPMEELLPFGGRAAENSGQHTVSPAPAPLTEGESGSRERLDRPAAS